MFRGYLKRSVSYIKSLKYVFCFLDCYRNVSETLPEYGIIHVFTNPEIFEFNPEIVPFKPFKGEKILAIKVYIYILHGIINKTANKR